jgi:CheY-like chemotaxis protein
MIGSGNLRGKASAAMRVLVVDQDSEMLEAVARAFEVDVATSKATCVDLLRANDFDVLVACERLSDGSGLELLSHVAKRWPAVVRILAMEPSRRAMLRGKLGPFKLFETIAYPIDEQELEAVLERTGVEWVSAEESEAAQWPTRTGMASRGAASSALASRAGAPRPPTPRAPVPSGPPPRASAQRALSRSAPPDSSSVRTRTPVPSPNTALPPLPRAGSKVVPLGTPGEEFRILPRDFAERESPALARARRQEIQRPQPAAPTIHEKAAALAVEAVAAVSAAVNRYMKPHYAHSKTPGHGGTARGGSQRPKTPPQRKR